MLRQLTTLPYPLPLACQRPEGRQRRDWIRTFLATYVTLYVGLTCRSVRIGQDSSKLPAKISHQISQFVMSSPPSLLSLTGVTALSNCDDE